MYRVLIERPNFFQKKCRHPVILLFQRACFPLVVPPEIPCPKLPFPQPVNSNPMLVNSNSMLVCESGSRRVRLWEQRRTNQGRATFESGSRCVRLWEQRRLNVGWRSLTSGRTELPFNGKKQLDQFCRIRN